MISIVQLERRSTVDCPPQVPVETRHGIRTKRQPRVVFRGSGRCQSDRTPSPCTGEMLKIVGDEGVDHASTERGQMTRAEDDVHLIGRKTIGSAPTDKRWQIAKPDFHNSAMSRSQRQCGGEVSRGRGQLNGGLRRDAAGPESCDDGHEVSGRSGLAEVKEPVDGNGPTRPISNQPSYKLSCHGSGEMNDRKNSIFGRRLKVGECNRLASFASNEGDVSVDQRAFPFLDRKCGRERRYGKSRANRNALRRKMQISDLGLLQPTRSYPSPLTPPTASAALPTRSKPAPPPAAPH